MGDGMGAVCRVPVCCVLCAAPSASAVGGVEREHDGRARGVEKSKKTYYTKKIYIIIYTIHKK
jgi:hypothetical protein